MTDPARLTREELFNRLIEEYQRLQATLAELTPAQMLEPGAVGFWSVKDMLAHLIFWNRYPVDELNAALHGQPMVFDHSDPDGINARAVALYQDRSLQNVLFDLNHTFRAIFGAIGALPDDAFTPDNALEQVLGDRVSGAFANNTYEHYALHDAQIRAWIATKRR